MDTVEEFSIADTMEFCKEVNKLQTATAPYKIKLSIILKMSINS